jgi:hypothetical protein
MAFTVNDVQDLVRLLAEHPEWRAQLRPLILGDEFDRLPAVVQGLAEAQRRTEARVEELAEAQRRTEARIEELAEAQRRTETRLEELAEAQRRTETRLEELALTVANLAKTVDKLVEEVGRVNIRMDRMDGHLTSMTFERRAPSYFGTWLRRPRVVALDELGVDDAVDDGRLSRDDFDSLLRLDFLVRGTDKRDTTRPETVLAVEISSTVDLEGVQRADERSQLLRALGLRAFGAVGGNAVSGRALEAAEKRGVLVKIVAEPK